MSFLLDTNVLSEVRRPQPEPRVLAWLDAADEDRLFLSVMTAGELARGIGLLAEGKRKRELRAWLETDLPARFGDRLLPVDGESAAIWGEIMAVSQRTGRNMGAMDGWIAATALRHELVLVTRNVKDFAGSGPDLLNPWSGEVL